MQYASNRLNQRHRLSTRAGQLLCALALGFMVGCGSGEEEVAPAAPAPAPPQANTGRPGLPPGVEPDLDMPPPPVAKAKPGAKAVHQAAKPAKQVAPPIAPGAEPDFDAPPPAPVAATANLAGGTAGAEPLLDGDLPPEQIQPAKPEFPADVNQWTAEHFRLARAKRNPKLVAAVRSLGRGNTENSESKANAALLIELLQAPAQGSTFVGAPGSEAGDAPVGVAAAPIPGVPEAIVESLAFNGTPEAQTTLKNLLLGKQSSDIPDRNLVVATLNTFAAKLDQENQKILAVVLTSPNSIRPAGRGQLTADQLQEECLRIVRPLALPEFRLQLAQRAAQGALSPAARQRLLQLLLTAEPTNIPAQVELSVNGQLDPAARATLDSQLAQASQQVLDRLLTATAADWSSPGAVRHAAPVAFEDDSPRAATPLNSLNFGELANLAHHLWRPDFGKAVAARVQAATNPENEQGLFALATSLPSSAVREALAERWDRQWTDEAPNARTVLQFAPGPRDPSLLLVLKQLPRESPRSVSADAAAKARPKAGADAKDTPQSIKQAKEQAARQEWLKVSESYIDGLSNYLAKAAETQVRGPAGSAKAVNSVDDFNSLLNSHPAPSGTASAAQPSGELFPADWNLKIHAPGDMQSSYKLDWPVDLKAPLAGDASEPLVIRFVRLNSLGDLNALASFYDRQLKLPLSRTTDKGRWVDGIVKLDGGRIRTVDVRLTRLDASSPSQRGTPERLVIDILCIEGPDPKQPTGLTLNK
jgi:hypothetical protein